MMPMQTKSSASAPSVASSLPTWPPTNSVRLSFALGSSRLERRHHRLGLLLHLHVLALRSAFALSGRRISTSLRRAEVLHR